MRGWLGHLDYIIIYIVGVVIVTGAAAEAEEHGGANEYGKKSPDIYKNDPVHRILLI